MVEILGETNWLKLPTPAKHHSNYFHALFYDRRSCWGHGTDKPPTGRVKERKKGDAMCPLTSQNPSHLHPSWLSNTCANRKDPMSEWLDRDNPKTNPNTVNPETANHMAEHSSWVPLPSCSPPRYPLPIQSLALSARASPWTIHFQALHKRPLSGPKKGPPSCNKVLKVVCWLEANFSPVFSSILNIIQQIHMWFSGALTEASP